MPKDDWKKSSIPTLFTEWGGWPWVDGPGDAPGSVLDVACGVSLKSKFISGARTRVGFDLHRPYLEAAREQNPLVDWTPIQGDVTKISEVFLPNSFDLVVALDIIEHVEKDQALKLLADLEEIAKVAVVLETPRGFLPQDLDILGFDQHHLQTHRCGFEKEELEELGYQVWARDYQLAPIKRHTTEPIATECQLLNAIKRVDGGAK
jgi:SAM-dependent methyltransferase